RPVDLAKGLLQFGAGGGIISWCEGFSVWRSPHVRMVLRGAGTVPSRSMEANQELPFLAPGKRRGLSGSCLGAGLPVSRVRGLSPNAFLRVGDPNPSPRPPPRSGEGEEACLAPPLRFGEGVGGRGWGR